LTPMNTKIYKSRAVLPGDVAVYIIVAAVAVLSSIALGTNDGRPEYVEINSGGQIERYPLYEERKLTLSNEGYLLTLVIESGRVWIEDADCPDRLCVKTGKISKPGESIICVPARISVRLTGGKDDSDAVAW